MQTTVMIMQGILAATFMASGIFVYANKEKLKAKLSWLTVYSPAMVLFICLSKIAGALALGLHLLTGKLTLLSAAASLGIALIMLLAFIYHIRSKEFKDLPATVLFFIISAFITLYNL